MNNGNADNDAVHDNADNDDDDADNYAENNAHKNDADNNDAANDTDDDSNDDDDDGAYDNDADNNADNADIDADNYSDIDAGNNDSANYAAVNNDADNDEAANVSLLMTMMLTIMPTRTTLTIVTLIRMHRWPISLVLLAIIIDEPLHSWQAPTWDWLRLAGSCLPYLWLDSGLSVNLLKLPKRLA